MPLILEKISPNKKNIISTLSFFILTFFISFSFTTHADFLYSLNIFNTIKNIFKKNNFLEEEKEFSLIIQILKNAPSDKQLLMPPINFQSRFTDTIDSNTLCTCMLSRADSIHFILHTPLTEKYIKNISIYQDLIKNITDPQELSYKLNEFMHSLNAGWILLPKHITLTNNLFEMQHSGQNWCLYKLKDTSSTLTFI